MTSLDPYERVFIHTLLYIHLISLFIALIFFMIVKEKAKESPVKNSFLAVHSMIILWILGKILKTIAPVLFLRWSFNIMYYIGILPLGPAFFIFSRSLLGRETNIRIQCLLYIPSIIIFFIALTNPLHYLFYDQYTFFKDSFGPVFYIHFILTYLFMISSIISLLYGAYKYKTASFKAYALIAGALLPLFINLNYILDILDPMFDITPIAYNISIIILGFAAFNFDFFNFFPEAVIKALDSLPGALKIKGRLLGKKPETIHKKHIKNTYLIKIKNRKITIERYIDTEIIYNQTETLKHIEKTKEQTNEEIYKEIEKRVSLVMQKERTKIAGELHDILGYSLSSIIFLLEHCRFSGLKDHEYRRNIDKALTISNKSINELNHQLSNRSQVLWKTKFFQLLSELEFYELRYELIVDQIDNYSDTLFRIFYKILKECITNCIKYSNADKLTIAIQKVSNTVFYVILDNGLGCENLLQGTGLTNMKRRIDEINGEIRFFSERNSGFQISISFPLLPEEEKIAPKEFIFSS